MPSTRKSNLSRPHPRPHSPPFCGRFGVPMATNVSAHCGHVLLSLFSVIFRRGRRLRSRRKPRKQRSQRPHHAVCGFACCRDSLAPVPSGAVSGWPGPVVEVPPTPIEPPCYDACVGAGGVVVRRLQRPQRRRMGACVPCGKGFSPQRRQTQRQCRGNSRSLSFTVVCVCVFSTLACWEIPTTKRRMRPSHPAKRSRSVEVRGRRRERERE